jgi:hypothetical protein
MRKGVTPRDYFGAQINRVTERSGKSGPYMMWEFTDDEGNRRVGFTDGDIVLGNRTWTWLHMLGIALGLNDEIEFDDLKDMECYVFLDDKGTVRMVASMSAADKPVDAPKEGAPEEPKQESTESEASQLFE